MSSSYHTPDPERAYLRRRRAAIKRAEAEANRFIDWLLDHGRCVDGNVVADFYQECRAEQLAALEQRERRREKRQRQSRNRRSKRRAGRAAA